MLASYLFPRRRWQKLGSFTSREVHEVCRMWPHAQERGTLRERHTPVALGIHSVERWQIRVAGTVLQSAEWEIIWFFNISFLWRTWLIGPFLETPRADLGYNDVPSSYLQFALLLWEAFWGAHVRARTHRAVHASQGKGAGSVSSIPFISWPETFVFKFHHNV